MKERVFILTSFFYVSQTVTRCALGSSAPKLYLISTPVRGSYIDGDKVAGDAIISDPLL